MKIPGKFHGGEQQEARRKKEINFLGRVITARNLNPAILEIPFRLGQISRAARFAGATVNFGHVCASEENAHPPLVCARPRVTNSQDKFARSATHRPNPASSSRTTTTPLLLRQRHVLLFTAPFNPDLHFTEQQWQVDPAEDCRGRYIRSFKDLRVETRHRRQRRQQHQGLRHADHVRVYTERRRRVKTCGQYFNSRPLSRRWLGSVAKDTCKLTPPSRPLWTLMNINSAPPSPPLPETHHLRIRKRTRQEQIRSFLPYISLLFARATPPEPSPGLSTRNSCRSLSPPALSKTPCFYAPASAHCCDT